jgi:hypothetical protein
MQASCSGLDSFHDELDDHSSLFGPMLCSDSVPKTVMAMHD